MPSRLGSTTTLDGADAVVDELAARKGQWVGWGFPERIRLLRACAKGVLKVADGWVTAACRAKGIDSRSSVAGEEWLAGPMAVVRNCRLLIETLKAGGRPSPNKMWTRSNGQQVARVFPAGRMDAVLFRGITADVWLEPDREPAQGRIYRDAERIDPGRVALVLGAGNVASIGPMDTLYKLFAENQVVVLKTNPVNAYLGPYLERAFAPLIDAGVFGIVHGDAEMGRHLCYHPQVDTVHLTGSTRTHDAIVWGCDLGEQARRQATNTPRLDKPITSELGCVTPVLVVPGPWSDADLAFQARHVAAMVANNASFNCNAAKVLITARDWPQRDAFIDKVRTALGRLPARNAYYPGARQRYQSFCDHYPSAIPLAPAGADALPWTIFPDVPPEPGEYALTEEAFCGVLAEVALDAADAPTFLERAVPFANDTVWGTLSCMMLVHPTTERAIPDAIDHAIANLRYGSIGVNLWSGVMYALGVTPWGAFPGHPLSDIQSGRGVVHNTLLFDHPQKAVAHAPFRIRPTPAWFADHRTLAALGRRLTRLEAAPSWFQLPGILATALRG